MHAPGDLTHFLVFPPTYVAGPFIARWIGRRKLSAAKGLEVPHVNVVPTNRKECLEEPAHLHTPLHHTILATTA